MPINWFEGWYFKQQAGENRIAFIPAVHAGGAGRSGSIQVITPDKSYYVEIPPDKVVVKRRPLTVSMGSSVFTLTGADLDIRGDGIRAAGRLRFGGLTPPRGDIMGPFKFVPLMECRHSVFSLTHPVGGSLTLNGVAMDFSGGTGYIEGDRGRSFPKRYVWTQCSWLDENRTGAGVSDPAPCALMLSAAEVKPFGRPFTGIIGAVFFRGREYRLATYRGAKLVSAGGGAVSVRQGAYALTAQLLGGRDQALRAPASGEMIRLVKESLSCRARYTFKEKDNVLFDFVSEQASFEYEL